MGIPPLPKHSFLGVFCPDAISGMRRVAGQGPGHAGLQRLELVEAEHARAARPHEHQPRIDDPWRRRRRDMAEALAEALVRAELDLRGEARLSCDQSSRVDDGCWLRHAHDFPLDDLSVDLLPHGFGQPLNFWAGCAGQYTAL